MRVGLGRGLLVGLRVLGAGDGRGACGVGAGGAGRTGTSTRAGCHRACSRLCSRCSRVVRGRTGAADGLGALRACHRACGGLQPTGGPSLPCCLLRQRQGRRLRGTQKRPAGVRGVVRPAVVRSPVLVRGGLLRHACRIHPSGAARCTRSWSRRLPDTRNTCPRNGKPAWSGVVPDAPASPVRPGPVLPSYASLTSCRPSVTYGQAQRMFRELRLCALVEDDPTVVHRGRIKGLMTTCARAYGPSPPAVTVQPTTDPGASAASHQRTVPPRPR